MGVKIRGKWIYYFWAAMDAIYLLRFCYINIANGRVPFYDDAVDVIAIYPQHGAYSLIFFILSLTLNLSMIGSIIAFFRQQ